MHDREKCTPAVPKGLRPRRKEIGEDMKVFLKNAKIADENYEHGIICYDELLRCTRNMGNFTGIVKKRYNCSFCKNLQKCTEKYGFK